VKGTKQGWEMKVNKTRKPFLEQKKPVESFEFLDTHCLTSQYVI
jgi:hypothetical protein